MNKKGFTLSEALLTLTILGVAGMLILPSLLTNVNQGVFKAKKYVLTVNFLNGMKNLSVIDGRINKAEKDENTSANGVFTGKFLNKTMQIEKVCNPENEGIKECGWKPEIGAYKSYDGYSNITLPQKNSEVNFEDGDSFMWAATTPNGVSLLIAYDKNCQKLSADEEKPKGCVNVIYDVNGAKSPNTVGKDVGFLTVFSPNSPRIGAPFIYFGAKPSSKASEEEAGLYCKNLTKKSDLSIFSKDEGRSAYFNYSLLNIDPDTEIWAEGKRDSSSALAICVYR